MNPVPKMNLSMTIQHPLGTYLRRGGGGSDAEIVFIDSSPLWFEPKHHKEHGNPNPNISASVPHPC